MDHLTILKSIHNIMRWAVALNGLIALFTAISGMSSRREFGASDKRVALFFLIAADIQLLLGLSLYFSSPFGFKLLKSIGWSAAMKDPFARFWTVEHMSGMLIAILLVHVGYAGTKGLRPSAGKFRRLFWCTLLALLVIAVTVPWPFRAHGIGRALFPG